MKLGNHRALGLAITPEGIAAAEVELVHGQSVLKHFGVLTPPSNETQATGVNDPGAEATGREAGKTPAPRLDLSQADSLGKALRQMLRREGFTASRCVIGLPAAWLACREKTLPAADDESIRGAMALATERDFASGPQELVFDYVRSQTTTGTAALVIAVPRRIVEQLHVLCHAAGLHMTAITPSVAALALAGNAATTASMVLCLQPHGVELALQSAGSIRVIRHLPIVLDRNAPQFGPLLSELRRVMASLGAGPAATAACKLAIWDGLGLATSAASELQRGLSMPVTWCHASRDLRLEEASASPSAKQSGPALPAPAALACFASGPATLDFLHSRLAAPKKKWATQRTRLAIAAAAAVVLFAAWALVDYWSNQSQIANMVQQLAKLDGPAKDAATVVDDVTFARSWYDHRPQLLNGLREVTQAFPQDGRIWATSMVIHGDLQISLSGKASSEAAVLEVLDHLKANPHLAGVKPQAIRKGTGAASEVAFSVSLTVRGVQ